MADLAVRAHLLPDRIPQSNQRAGILGLGLPAARPAHPHHPGNGRGTRAGPERGKRLHPQTGLMRYLDFATDYDGTLAHHGQVDGDTVDALRRLKASGRKLVLVTGRQMDDLARVFPELPLFDVVVGENGALIYRPERRETRRLADPPPSSFVEELRRRGVEPLAVGQVVVATEQPNERVVVEVIRELGLELQVIVNKGSVMVLPSSVNKASWLQAALDVFARLPPNVVGS